MNRATIKRVGSQRVDVQLSGSTATLSNIPVIGQIDMAKLNVGTSVLVDIVNDQHVVLATLDSNRSPATISGVSNIGGTVINNALLADGSVPLTGNLAVIPGATIDGYDISVLGQTIDNLQAADSVARTGFTVLSHASHLVSTIGPSDNQILIRHGIFHDKEQLAFSNTSGEIEIMRVVGQPQPAVDNSGAPCWRYTVTRRIATNPGGIVIGWAAATLVNGLTHRGYISFDGRNNSPAAPSMRVVLHTDIDAGSSEHIMRAGSLNNILGYGNQDFGFAAGRLTTGDRYFAYNYNRNLLALRGADISLSDDSGVEAFRVWGVPEGDHDVGDTRLGKVSGGHIETSGNEVTFFAGSQRVMTISPLGSRFRGMIWTGPQPGPGVGIGEESGQGLIAARNPAGIGQFVVRTGDVNVHVHMGNPVELGGYAQFANGQFTTDGIIRARAFELIGGGTINPGSTLTNAGKFTAGSGNNVAVIDGEDATWRVYAGHATPASAPFRVNQTGETWLTNAHVTGEVNATAGVFGGWTLNSSYLSATNVGLAPADFPFYAGAAYASRASAPFRVTPAGALTATSGTVGGWTLGASSLVGGNATLHNSGYLNLGTGNDIARLDAADATYRLWIGNAVAGSAPFQVTKAGALTASNATVTGTINASAGSIAGWTIASGHLYAGSAANRTGLQPASYPFYAGSETPASAPFRVTPAGALTASNATITGTINAAAGNITGSLYVGAANPRLHLDGANKRIESTNFASGTSGFRIEGVTGNAEFNNVTVRGALAVTVLQYGYVQATSGSVWVTKAAGRSLNAFTEAEKESTANLDIEDPAGMTHAGAGGLWAVGDVVRMKEPLIGDFWGTITSKTDMTTFWRLAVSTQDGGGVFPAGAAVLNYGQSGDGVVRITADAANNPYVSIATHAGSPWTTLTERARLGNLTGISGASGYGLWTNNGFFTGTVTASAGNIAGWTLATNHLYAGSGANRVGLQPLLYPFYAGSETQAAAPFRVNTSGLLVATNAIITGTVTANAGSIAGWTINSTHLAKDTGTNNTSAGMAPDDYPFYAGSTYANRASAPFRVDPAGGLYATAGSVGGFTISFTEGLFAGTGVARVQMKPGVGFWAGATAQGDAPFRVTAAGALTASDVNITAGGGNVTLDANGLRLAYANTGTAYVAWYSGTTLRGYIGSFLDGSTNVVRANVQSSGRFEINGAGEVLLSGTTQVGNFRNSGGLAFFSTSGSGTSKQTVTGSRGGNAALASLLTALAAYGLITDSTTA